MTLFFKMDGSSKNNRNVVESVNLERQLISVEYPGLVNNVQEAIRTMGGILGMSVAHAQPNRKIDLKFRPDDPFCKSAHGEKIPTSNLLMKVVKKTRRNKTNNTEEVSYHMFIEGVVKITYKFQGLCDFQYLPMEKTPNCLVNDTEDSHISILDEITPSGLVTLDWLKEPSPVFMSPPLFSRMDLPVEYHFRKDSNQATTNSNVIGRLRKRRSLQAIFLNFEDPFVPDKPRDIAVRNLAVRFIKQDDVDLIKKLFDERPVYTKAALAYAAQQVENNALKYIIAATAYYFTTGPWRNTWVKIGYDPRKDPSSRKFQILDYRLMHNLKSKVTPKRSYSGYTQPHKLTNSYRVKPSSIHHRTEPPAPEMSERSEVSCIFRPGFIPECRQMFYQYCDLRVPEIEEMLEITPYNDSCDERHGWFPSSVEEDCRKILNSYIQESFRQNKLGKKNSGGDAEEKDDEEEIEEDPLAPETDTNLQESMEESCGSDEEYQPGMNV